MKPGYTDAFWVSILLMKRWSFIRTRTSSGLSGSQTWTLELIERISDFGVTIELLHLVGWSVTHKYRKHLSVKARYAWLTKFCLLQKDATLFCPYSLVTVRHKIDCSPPRRPSRNGGQEASWGPSNPSRKEHTQSWKHPKGNAVSWRRPSQARALVLRGAWCGKRAELRELSTKKAEASLSASSCSNVMKLFQNLLLNFLKSCFHFTNLKRTIHSKERDAISLHQSRFRRLRQTVTMTCRK